MSLIAISTVLPTYTPERASMLTDAAAETGWMLQLLLQTPQPYTRHMNDLTRWMPPTRPSSFQVDSAAAGRTPD